MRASDIARLSEPFSADEESPDTRAMCALGLDLAPWKGLETAIFDDFVDSLPYGIGWWAPGPGTSRRILIGDQLYACTVSVSVNMIETICLIISRKKLGTTTRRGARLRADRMWTSNIFSGSKPARVRHV